MASLQSPGVQVSIINNASAPQVAAGTVPTVFIASQSNKLLSDGVTVAPGTLPANAGAIYTITSQRELLQTFGNPFFNSIAGTVQQGDEVNEVGLHAAWSYLGLANSINVIRADLDMKQLMETTVEPTSAPVNGTYWFDYAASAFGAFRANGNPIAGLAWNQLAVLTPTFDQVANAIDTSHGTAISAMVPLDTFGAAGNLAVTIDTITHEVLMFEKVSTTWLLIGSAAWHEARPTVVTGTVGFASHSAASTIPAGNIVIGRTITDGITVAIAASAPLDTVILDINTAAIPNVTAGYVLLGGFYFLTITDATGANIIVTGTGSLLTALGTPAGTTKGYALNFATNNAVPVGTHAGDIWIKTTNPNFGSNYVVKLYNAPVAQFQTVAAPLAIDDVAAEVAQGLALQRLYVEYNTSGTVAPPQAAMVIKRLASLAAISVATTAYNPPIPGSFSIRTRASAGATVGADTTVVVTVAGGELVAALATKINAAVATSSAMPHVVASVVGTQLQISSTNGSAVDLIDGTNNILTSITMPRGVFSNWVELSYAATLNAPTQVAAEGTLWFNPTLTVDIMVNDGNTWVSYKTMYPATDAAGAQVTSAEPVTQTNGNPLVDHDLWIKSDNVVGYPAIYRYLNGAFTLVDNTDHVTPMGVVFGDVRQDSGPTGSWLNGANPSSTLAADLLLSSFVDPVDLQILNPQIFPAGILMFNTEIGTDNVKIRHNQYFAGITAYTVGTANFNTPAVAAYLQATPGRWVTASGNDINGVVLMGRFAQREMVVKALAAQIVDNQNVRSEALYFNLLACPGYVEVLADLVGLNIDRQETAFIITDVPATLTPDATSINNWATDAANAATDGRLGRITAYDYAAMYYPWGLGTNVDGANVAIPSSTIALRTYGYNDRVGYPWTPPAGTRRGIVSNASSVGHIDINTMEYVPTNVNQGQRDALYTNNINPILFKAGNGLVVRGDKTLSADSTGLTTRVNVARTVVYLRYILPQLFEKFLFELNTVATRAAAKDLADKFMVGLVGLGAITDFAVVCDASNNTPATIAANELFIDVAVVPVFAIDFIYIPVSLQIGLNQ